MAKDKKTQRQTNEGSGILVPVLIAAMVCVALTTTFIVGYGLQYTAEQRAIEAQQSESAAPVRSLPSPSASLVQTISAPPKSESQQPGNTDPVESTPAEESLPVAPSPSVSPSASAAPSVRPTPTPSDKPSEIQAPASPVQSNTTQGQTGNSGGGRGNADNFYTYDNPEQQNTDAK